VYFGSDNRFDMLRDSLEQLTPGLGLDGELAHGEGPQPVQLLLGLQLLLVRGQCLPDGTSLLGPQVLGNVLLVLVELAHVGLGRLVDDDIDAGDVLADDADLGELAGGAAGDLGHAERGQLGLQLIQLLGELLLFLAAELVTLHDGRLSSTLGDPNLRNKFLRYTSSQDTIQPDEDAWKPRERGEPPRSALCLDHGE